MIVSFPESSIALIMAVSEEIEKFTGTKMFLNTSIMIKCIYTQLVLN